MLEPWKKVLNSLPLKLLTINAAGQFADDQAAYPSLILVLSPSLFPKCLSPAFSGIPFDRWRIKLSTHLSPAKRGEEGFQMLSDCLADHPGHQAGSRRTNSQHR
jgi:hypothetical protein